MSVRNLLTTFLMAVSLAAGSFADEPAAVPDSSSADIIPLSDSAARLPEVDEFVPVEVIAEMTGYEQPVYPPLAEAGGIQGLVWIKALVSSTGKVLEAVVYKSSGHRILDEAALSAAPGCRFKPAIQGGRPVAMWVTYKVDFILEGRPRFNFSVGVLVDTLVQSLKGDTLPETSLSKGYKFANPLDSQGFSILILKESEGSRPGKQKAIALIDGGCATGLEAGMKGTVWGGPGEDFVKLANVEVTDVQAFEAVCTLESIRRRTVTRNSKVVFDIQFPGQADLVSRGETYFEAGKTEEALACFEAVSDLADSNPVVRARLDVCRKSQSIGAHALNSEDSAAVTRRIPGWLTLAGAYIRLDKPDHARRVTRKILAFDSTNVGGLELENALDVYDSCRIDLKKLFFGRGDTTAIERLPRIVENPTPLLRYPPFEYYQSLKKERPPDTVWVRAFVSSRGNVMKAELHRSSGIPELDWAALESASETKFVPGISCGRPMAMWVKWKVEFRREPS